MPRNDLPNVFWVTDHPHEQEQALNFLRDEGHFNSLMIDHLDGLFDRLERAVPLPDLIVLDDGPPSSTDWVGADIVERLKGQPTTRSIPIVIITTGYRDPLEGAHAYQCRLEELGVAAIMPIPFDFDEMAQIISNALTSSAA